jgi:hypothetical protein
MRDRGQPWTSAPPRSAPRHGRLRTRRRDHSRWSLIESWLAASHLTPGESRCARAVGAFPTILVILPNPPVVRPVPAPSSGKPSIRGVPSIVNSDSRPRALRVLACKTVTLSLEGEDPESIGLSRGLRAAQCADVRTTRTGRPSLSPSSAAGVFCSFTQCRSSRRQRVLPHCRRTSVLKMDASPERTER